jgi:hypothetical protein
MARRALVLAPALLALGAASAQAAGSSLTAEGLHISTGALVDPAGRTWVADHNAGFCRVTNATDTTPGKIEHPELPGQAGTRTCLGGLLPDAGTGPDAAGQPTLYDPSPGFPNSGDELAFIPDGASPSSEVVRAQWNRNTEKFEFRDTITMQGARGRPTAVALGPDDNLYVTFQRENTIQRIRNIDAELPVSEIVGNPSDGRGPAAIAVGGTADAPIVYVAETVGLRELAPSSVTQPTTVGTSLPAAPGTISALIYDRANDALYAGTADAAGPPVAEGSDRVHRYNPSATGADRLQANYATGYSMVGGFGLERDGDLIVVDDPALLDPLEPLGAGRMFVAGKPAAHANGPKSTKERHPEFTVTGDGVSDDAQLQCRVTGNGVDTGWDDCAGDGSYIVGPELADGDYVLSVRAVDGDVTGLAEAFRFSVDNEAPSAPQVTKPADGGLELTKVGSTPWFEFRTEDGASLECKLDDAAEFTPCANRGRLGTFADGEHTIVVRAIDRAGNVSAETTRQFMVDATVQPGGPAPWGPGPANHKGSSRYADGLHISAGSLVDPMGRVWVSDHNGGFCRVTAPTENGPGTIDHPSVPGGPGPRTCLGGLLPEAGTGPDAAGQPSLVDPTPDNVGNGDEMALIPDGARPSSDVVRAKWNPDTEQFEFHDIVTMIGDGTNDPGVRSRPTATAPGPDGEVYVVFQDSGTVERIANAAGSNPSVAIVGRPANGRRAETVAAGRDADGGTRVYVAEDGGLTSLEPRTNQPPTAAPVAFAANAGTISALKYDLERDHLWVGTANGVTQADEGIDQVHRFSPQEPGGAPQLGYATGYSMVGGLGLRPDGVLYVVDDPALLDPAEPLGTGRMFQVGMPSAKIARGPLNDAGEQSANRAFTSDSTPTFEVEGDFRRADGGTATPLLECKLSGEGITDPQWVACDESGRFTPATELADGSYVLAVRATDGDAVSIVETHKFTVDTVAPARPAVTSPTQNELVPAKPWFVFTGEVEATFECSWDGGAFEECATGYNEEYANPGTHTVQVRAIDRAGNVSEESQTRTFRTAGTPDPVEITSAPAALTRNTSAAFAFDAGEAQGMEYECRLVGRSSVWEPCTSPKSYSGLADGTYTFEVHGQQVLPGGFRGDVTAVTRHTFRVDTTGPTVNVIFPDQGELTGPSPGIRMSANESGSTLQCRIDGQAFDACGTTRVFSNLSDGAHTFEVFATDEAGNAGPTTTRNFVVISGTGAPESAPAPAAAPQEPSVTVTDRTTGQPLTIRISDIDRRVNLADLQQAGVQVTVIPPRGTQQIRFRIFRAAGGGQNRRGRAASVPSAAARKALATEYKKVAGKKGKINVTLRKKAVRRLKPGRYVLEVTSLDAKGNKVGGIKKVTFTVRR